MTNITSLTTEQEPDIGFFRLTTHVEGQLTNLQGWMDLPRSDEYMEYEIHFLA